MGTDSVEIAKQLVKADADPFLRNVSGQTALLWAKHNELHDLLNMLEEMGGARPTTADVEASERLSAALEKPSGETEWILKKQDAESLMRSLGKMKDNFRDACEGLLAKM